MSNTPTIIATPAPFTPETFTKYRSITGTYAKSGMTTEGGTDNSHSMADTEIKLKVETPSTIQVSLLVDDWGSITITDSEGTPTELVRVANGVNGLVAGIRGGNPSPQLVSNTFKAVAGDYTITITHDNITYDTSRFDPRYNDAVCNFSIAVVPSIPTRADIVFNAYGSGVNPADKRNSVASGRVFLGTLTFSFENGLTQTHAVQSGGWMARNSPWSSLYQTLEDLESYDPTQYPDTVCPELASTTIGTELNGGQIDGYPINTQGVGGRSGIEVHLKERYGSEGCPSTDDNWEGLQAVMGVAEDAGKATLPLSVSYSGVEAFPNRQP